MGRTRSSASRTSRPPRRPSRTWPIVLGDSADRQRRVSAPAHGCGMNPIDDALPARMAARRHRQVVEIAGLMIAGNIERAEGLALVHESEFPQDAQLLDCITASRSGVASKPLTECRDSP